MAPHPSTPLPTSYNWLEVTASILIAVAASYVALFLAERLFAARGRMRWWWLVGGAAAMGIGIWAMHFTGMLAFSLPVPVAYDWAMALGSLGIAIGAAALALFLGSRRTMSTARMLGGSTSMGAGIAGLHYMAMAAMRMAAVTTYNLGMVAASVMLAILFSLAALWLTFYFHEQRPRVGWRKVAAALAMGAAISGMHYTGMASATFFASDEQPIVSKTVPASALAFAGIAIVSMLVLALAMASTLVDRRFGAQALDLALAEAKLELSRMTRLATVGQLTASIAHELNQPLGAIKTYGAAALRWLNAQPPDINEARQAVVKSVNEATRAGEMIARTRALLRHSPVQRSEVNVNEVIQDVMKLVTHELARTRVNVESNLPPDLPPVLADRVQLQQVMLNLVVNAIEAMKSTDGGRELYIHSERVGSGIRVEVQDTGAGFAAAEADRIFEPFYTTKVEGMGMGLSISRAIIDAHGGQLSARPGASGGAVFEFTLPKVEYERAA